MNELCLKIRDRCWTQSEPPRGSGLEPKSVLDRVSTGSGSDLVGD